MVIDAGREQCSLISRMFAVTGDSIRGELVAALSPHGRTILDIGVVDGDDAKKSQIWLFDVPILDGKVLISETFAARHKIIETLTKTLSAFGIISKPYQFCDSSHKFECKWNDKMMMRQDGLEFPFTGRVLFFHPAGKYNALTSCMAYPIGAPFPRYAYVGYKFPTASSPALIYLRPTQRQLDDVSLFAFWRPDAWFKEAREAEATGRARKYKTGILIEVMFPLRGPITFSRYIAHRADPFDVNSYVNVGDSCRNPKIPGQHF